MTALDTGTEDPRAEIDDGVAVITMNPPRSAKRPLTGHGLGPGGNPRPGGNDNTVG
jgi:hypothetical protein